MQFSSFAKCIDLYVDEKWKRNIGRVNDRKRLVEIIQKRLNLKDRESWLNIFKDKGFAYGAVRTVKDALECESIRDSRLVMKHGSGRVFEGLRSAIRTDHWDKGGREVNGETFPPFLGEHSEELLRGLGIEEKEIGGMIKRGEVVQWVDDGK